MPKKQPYIPVYMGDDLRECGHLALEVYGGYCKLRFALWDREDRGRMVYDVRSFMRLLGADTLQHAETIVQTLVNERVLKTEEIDKVKYLVRQEMVEEHILSIKRKAAASNGGKRTQQNRNQNKNIATDFALANNQAKREQNPEYENDIDNEGVNEKKVGGLGEGDFYSEYKEYPVDDCLKMYKTSGYDEARNTLAGTYKIAPAIVLEWVEIFTTEMKARNQPQKTMADYAQHFANWLRLKADKTNPQNYLNNARNNSKDSATTKTGAGTHATAVIQRERPFNE